MPSRPLGDGRSAIIGRARTRARGPGLRRRGLAACIAARGRWPCTRGPRRRGGRADAVAAVVRRIGCLQLDPGQHRRAQPAARAVRSFGTGARGGARARGLPRSRAVRRLGARGLARLHRRPAADRWAMRTVHEGSGARAVRAREFLDANAAFCDDLVAELRARGPLRARELEDRSAEPWRHGWWTDEVSGRQTIARLLHMLWLRGRVGVGGRIGGERLWDVFERCLPAGAAAGVARPRRRAGRARGRAARRADARSGAPGPHPRALPASPLRAVGADAVRARRGAATGAGLCRRAGRGCVVRRAGGSGRGGVAGTGLADDGPVPLRQPALRPCPRGGAAALRPSPRDLRPARAAALGLLRPADPAPRADRRAGRRRARRARRAAARARAAPRARGAAHAGARPRRDARTRAARRLARGGRRRDRRGRGHGHGHGRARSKAPGAAAPGQAPGGSR